MGMVSQRVLPFQMESERLESGLTGLAGLPVYLELAQVAGFRESVSRHVRVREGGQGFTDAQMVTALVLLNLAGGDCVEDLRQLVADEGFCKLLCRVEWHGLPRRQRRELERRFRRGRERVVPSSSSVFRYLSRFHDEEQEKARVPGAYIPAPGEALRGLSWVNADLLAFVQRRSPQRLATLDQDATVVATQKKTALWSYQKCRAYQPQNVWWAEQGLVVHTEFRDGNVPAGYEQLRVLKEALERLPAGVEQVRLRSDAAGYQHELMRYCEKGESERFGRIEFAIGCPISPEFERAVAEVEPTAWSRLGESEQEWAEVCFVPNAVAHTSGAPVLRYLAIREALRQRILPECEEQLPLPDCPIVSMQQQRYKVSGLVSNRHELPGEELIGWYRQRCGKSEEAHSVMKEDLAGGKLPSADFGENAAWWWIMILALNLNAAMKRLVLGKSWANQRMKALRFHLICLSGRLIEHGRQLVLRLARNHPSLELLLEARRRIYDLHEPARAG